MSVFHSSICRRSQHHRTVMVRERSTAVSKGKFGTQWENTSLCQINHLNTPSPLVDYTSARLLRVFIPFLLCRVSVLTLALFGCRSHVDVLRHFVGRGHCQRNRFFKWECQRCSQIFLKDPDSHGKSPLNAVIFISGHLTEPTPVSIVLFCFLLLICCH